MSKLRPKSNIQPPILTNNNSPFLSINETSQNLPKILSPPMTSRPSTRTGQGMKREPSPISRRLKDVFDRLYRTGTCCSFTKVDSCHSCAHCLKSRFLSSYKRQQSVPSRSIPSSSIDSTVQSTSIDFQTKSNFRPGNESRLSYADREQLRQQYPNIAHHFNFHRPSETFAQFVARHRPHVKHEVQQGINGSGREQQNHQSMKPTTIQETAKSNGYSELSWNRSFSEMDMKVLQWLDKSLQSRENPSPPSEERTIEPWAS
jgi:hypothetical protein